MHVSFVLDEQMNMGLYFHVMHSIKMHVMNTGLHLFVIVLLRCFKNRIESIGPISELSGPG